MEPLYMELKIGPTLSFVARLVSKMELVNIAM